MITSEEGIKNVRKVLLDAVTTDTTSDTYDTRKFSENDVYVSVSGNTGAVTVTIQASDDGTNWVDIDAKTYTATNLNDIFRYDAFSYLRVKTSTQSNSTVTAAVVGA